MSWPYSSASWQSQLYEESVSTSLPDNDDAEGLNSNESAFGLRPEDRNAEVT